MSSQRPSFAKRDREMKLKEKARIKAERRAARKAEKAAGPSTGPGEATDDVVLVDGATPPAHDGVTVASAVAPTATNTKPDAP